MGFMDTINAMTVNSSEGSAANPQQNKIELLPHNQELYDMIVEKINEDEKSIFYSEGTGLGKSFIFMRLVQDFFANKKVLYIVPKIAIWDNLTHYEDFKKIENNVDMVTFTKFNTYPYDEEYCTKYDAVFVDECHHMLSDIQGKNVKQLLDNMTSWDKFAFGMTATPEVNGVYVDEEMFDVSCYGLDMYQAIERGIFPKMDIAIGIKEDLDIPDNLREKFSVTGTQTLLDRVLYDYRHVTHWLAYFTTQEELEQNESELRKLFPDYKLLKIYNGCGDSSVIEEFENSIAPVILMSVSMFLEGMHLKNVGGVLLYRNIQKSHTYAQILGRLCVIGQKYTPVMVDITGSILNMKQFYVPKSPRASEGQRKKYDRRDIFDVTSKGYELLELIEVSGILYNTTFSIDYRGIKARNAAELGRALGMSSVYVPTMLRAHPSWSFEDVIDNWYKIRENIVDYKGFKAKSISDLCAQLGCSLSKYYTTKDKNGGKLSLEEFIDIQTTKSNPTPIVDYRGIIAYSEGELCEKVGKEKHYLYGRRKSGFNCTYEELIDKYYESKENEIVIGSDVYVSENDFCRKLGFARSKVKRLRAEGFSYEQIATKKFEIPICFIEGIPVYSYHKAGKILNIDSKILKSYLDKGMSVDDIRKYRADLEIRCTRYRGVNVFSQRTANADMQMGSDYVGKIMRKYQLSIEEAVDYIFETRPDIRAKFEDDAKDDLEYKGVPITSAADASRHIGKNPNYIHHIMKRKKIGIKEAIDFALSRLKE